MSSCCAVVVASLARASGEQMASFAVGAGAGAAALAADCDCSCLAGTTLAALTAPHRSAVAVIFSPWTGTSNDGQTDHSYDGYDGYRGWW